MSTPPNFRTVVKSAITIQGMSLRALHLRSGVSYSTVHGYVTGNRPIESHNLEAICEVLGLVIRVKNKLKKVKDKA